MLKIIAISNERNIFNNKKKKNLYSFISLSVNLKLT